MIQIDNLQFLRQGHPTLLENVSKLEPVVATLPYEVMATRNGMPNLAVKQDGNVSYLHSQYDPKTEADRFVNQFQPGEVAEYDHVFFYGVGMGYHVEAFMGKYPNMQFSVYEPDGCVFYHYLSERKLSNLPLHRLRHVFVEFTPEFLYHHLNDFLARNQEKILFVVLPSYERIFKEQYERFCTEFRNAVTNRRSSLHTNMAFEKRWTINSLATLTHTLKTPNILASKASFFRDKPVLLVAAGPSLQEEIEHIRHIKENGLAYIFSVGSSVLSLLEHDILPDAVCSYDPQPNTVETYNRIIEEKITSIPLIYGTSVGFETVEHYPGPKLHMFTSQDTVAPLYVRTKEGGAAGTVMDAPSIAVVTLELLYKLGANPIVLIGQNFAYKNKQFYSQGISYSTPTQQRPTEISDEELSRAIQVESVDGSSVYTNPSFNTMRKQMEAYITNFEQKEIINTTQGGARIANTEFIPLQDLIKDRFTERVVVPDWYEWTQADKIYDFTYIRQQEKIMDTELKWFHERIQKLGQLLHEMKNLYDHKNEKQLSRIYPALDKEFKKLQKNKIFTAVLLPMNRVENEILARNVTAVRFEPDILLKTRKIIDWFGHFLFRCQQEVNMIQPLFVILHSFIEQYETAEVSAPLSQKMEV